LLDVVEEAAGRIRRLEVQGATNVAITAVNALSEQMRLLESVDRASVSRLIEEAKEVLFSSRETEPFMRNAVRYMEWGMEGAKWGSRQELGELVHSLSEKLLGNLGAARKTIIEIGSRRVLQGTVVLTHCHSSAVSGILREAGRKGVDFRVVCSETRPVYQGRITARELLEAGIETTMIVDSAMRTFLKEADLVLVGADAITSEGNVINKIGTSQLALAANEARVPFYVAAELLKFDPQTVHGEYEEIEERDASEIWPDAPEGLRIRNPAFDVTRRGYIHGIICEEGVISPHSIVEAVRRRYPWIMEYSRGV
jgi:ribose 1,5-bisphosphate isomerase